MATSAVAGAHLTGTRDTIRPSVFEILSHEGFASALKPAVFHVIKVSIIWLSPYFFSHFSSWIRICGIVYRFRYISLRNSSNLSSPVCYILQIFAEKNPAGKFAVVYRYFDELYLSFDAIIQWHYILTRGRCNVVFKGYPASLNSPNIN